MDTGDDLIRRYAKKIMGFAFSKTSDPYEAEDLAQEILTVLCGMPLEEKNIAFPDSWIYQVCCYTWSNYLRRNKPHRMSLQGDDAFLHLADARTPEREYLEKELYVRLRQEIMFLGRTRRDIMIRFYYDNLSGEEIADLMGISHATVRWHLRQTRIDLKERLTMDQTNTIYQPIRLLVGHHGWTQSPDMHGLCSDALVQNICYACYGKPMDIEEIARTLGVAAIYLEDKIERLLAMDYLKKVQKKKFQTNFFIRDKNFNLADKTYRFQHILPLARQFFETVKAALPAIRELSFTGSDVGDDELMWNILPVFISMKTAQIDDQIIERRHLTHAAPLRKDGSQHWVHAYLAAPMPSETDCSDPELREFIRIGADFGIKRRTADNVNSLAYDLQIFDHWRPLETEELKQLQRIRSLLEKGEAPNDYDKSLIAHLTRLGIMSVTDQIPRLLIPYLTKEQMADLKTLLKESAQKHFDDDHALKIFEGYGKEMSHFIPSFIDENERRHILTSFSPQGSSMYLLWKNGFLKTPDESQKKRFCMIVWEE